VSRASAAGGGYSEQGEAPRSEFAEREREKQISGTARGIVLDGSKKATN
jgi:hypothetical protein